MRLTYLYHEFICQIERSQLNLQRIYLQDVVFSLYFNFTVLVLSILFVLSVVSKRGGVALWAYPESKICHPVVVGVGNTWINIRWVCATPRHYNLF